MKIHYFVSIILICLCKLTYAQVAKIPFEFFENKYVLLQLQLNNSKNSLTFYFDTGATVTVVDSTTADEIGLVSNYKQEVVAAGGIKTYKTAVSQTVNITDKVKIDGVHIVLDNLTRLQTTLGKKIDGIIGYSILKNYKTKIDFDNRLIELYPFSANLDTKDYSELDFVFESGILIPQFPVTIELKNGKKLTDKVFFDSGAGLSLLINTAFKLKNNLLTDIGKTVITESHNLNSISIMHNAVIKSLQISKFTFGENVISLSSDAAGVSSYNGYLGILGSEIISRFNFIADYSKNKLFLKANTFFKSPFEFPVSGIKLKNENGLILVHSVVKHSKAYRMGLRANYCIISINGFENANIEIYRRMLKIENSKVRITYRTENDKTKKIKFKLKRLI